MNIATMRLLDRWAGVPLCTALTWVRRLTDAVRRATSRADGDHLLPADGRPGVQVVDGQPMGAHGAGLEPPRVLLVKLAEMGSTVLALPAIARLQQAYSGVRLHYLCFAENRHVVDLLPGVQWEGVHTIRTDSFWRVARDGLKTLATLRRLRLDAAIDLEMFSRGSAVLVYLSGARIRAGFHRFFAEGLNCGDLFTHRLSYNGHAHTSQAFLALVEALGHSPCELPMLKQRLPAPTGLPRFEPTEDERQAVRRKLMERGWPGDNTARIIILNANASDLLPLRRWPTERFIELARRCLSANERHWVVLTGSPSEQSAIETLARQIGHERVISMAGATTLREVVALYGLADVLVTNDSGPAHFAALTPVRIISLFGPETPELYRPLSEVNRSITAGLACSPCINVFNSRLSACRDNRCMKAISVDEVFAAVSDAMRERPS